MEWNKLSMTDRARYIKLAVENGVTNLVDIRDTYNKYDTGGVKEERSDKTNVVVPERIVSPKLFRYLNRTSPGDDNSVESINARIKDARDFYNLYINSAGFFERLNKLPDIAKRVDKYAPPYIIPNIPVTTDDKLITHYGYSERQNPFSGKRFISKEYININPESLTFSDSPIFDKYDPYYLYKEFGDTKFPIGFSENHEEGHHVDNELSRRESLRVNHSNLYYKLLTPNKEVNSHDNNPKESYADLLDFRKRLYDDGIYDSIKSGNLFTKEHLDKAKEFYKGQFIRLFNSFTDDRIIQIMNTVAQNNDNQYDWLTPNYTAFGGKLKRRK